MAKLSRAVGFLAAIGLAAVGPGCGLVPKERLEECHRLSRSLQAETAQLKDQTLTLRAHNQDLAQRAIDDAQRIRELDEANQRLERSVLAYQAERDKLSAAFELFKSQLTAAVDHVPTALLDQFDGFARRHPEVAFDAARGVLSMPADRLFEPGTDVWTPGARALLEELAGILSESEGKAMAWQVLATPGQAAEKVERASFAPGREPASTLSASRARLVRDLLARLAGIDSTAIEGDTASAPPPGRPGDRPAPEAGPSIEIHVRARSAAGSRTPPPAPEETIGPNRMP